MARQRFTSATAREAGRKSGEARRARKTKREEAVKHATELIRPTGGELGPLARVTAADVMSRVLSGEIPIRNGSDAANMLKTAHDVARLEAGEATAITVNAALSAEGIQAAAEQLRQRVLEAKAAGELEPGNTPDDSTSAIDVGAHAEPHDVSSPVGVSPTGRPRNGPRAAPAAVEPLPPTRDRGDTDVTLEA